jgi:hypothetical protein
MSGTDTRSPKSGTRFTPLQETHPAVSASTAVPEIEGPCVNTATVAQRLDLAARRVRRLCAEGRFDGAHKVGIELVIPAAEIQAEAA